MDISESGGSSSTVEELTFVAVEPKVPTCHVCGSTHLTSQGHNWLCADCGKYQKKGAKYCPHCGQIIR
jgi:predicted amidophosphoribosyltransferase